MNKYFLLIRKFLRLLSLPRLVTYHRIVNHRKYLQMARDLVPAKYFKLDKTSTQLTRLAWATSLSFTPKNEVEVLEKKYGKVWEHIPLSYKDYLYSEIRKDETAKRDVLKMVGATYYEEDKRPNNLNRMAWDSARLSMSQEQEDTLRKRHGRKWKFYPESYQYKLRKEFINQGKCK